MLAVYNLTPVTLLTEIILKKHFQAFLDQKHALVEYPDASQNELDLRHECQWVSWRYMQWLIIGMRI